METTSTSEPPEAIERLSGLQAFIARQPIFNTDLEAVAYELLYRDRVTDAAEIQDGHRATSMVLLNAMVDFGLHRLVGRKEAFINVPRGYLIGEYSIPLPSHQVVLEVLEDQQVDQTLVDGVRALRGQGFRIALDDCVGVRGLEPLLPLVQLAKIDILGMTPEQIADRVEIFRPHGVQLLAEKVETSEEYELCRDLGFELFQGFFFSRPTVLARRRMPANRAAQVRLLTQLYDPDVELRDVQRLVAQDVTLSYRLLRFLNSAGHGLKSAVESVQHATVLLGLDQLRRWITLVALSGLDDKPSELVSIALLRARLCEVLGARLGHPSADRSFTVGLLSVVDALLDEPMREAVQRLGLSPEVSAALSDHQGPEGALLGCLLAHEQGRWEPGPAGPELAEFNGTWLDAVDWADEQLGSLIG